MLNRDLVVWFILLVLAFIDGGVREAWIIPSVGDTPGHAISTITLCTGILVLSWITIAWMRPLSTREVWTIGGVWGILTGAFEFVAGHYLFGNPWSRFCWLTTTFFKAASGCSSSSRPLSPQ